MKAGPSARLARRNEPMQESQPSVFTRDDTLFGVCQALGEDFGFNPNYLRIAFGASLLWNPVAVVGAYLAAGVAVALSRWLAPNPRSALAQQEADAHEAVMLTPADEHEPRAAANAGLETLAVAA